MYLKPSELPEEIYGEGRVSRSSQGEVEIVYLILYLITLVGREKMKFHQ